MRSIALALPLSLLALACSSTTTVTGADAGGAADAANGGDETGAGEGGDEAAPPPYCPTGYTFVPFVTDTATTHTYAKPDQVIDPTKDYLEVLDTDVGTIVWQYYVQDTPIATNSFVFLTLHHFFDGILFHRVIAAFMAQSGDPTTLMPDPMHTIWGTGDPGYSYNNEISPNHKYNAPGMVGVANHGDSMSCGSQFFITFVPYPSLDTLPSYTLMGHVIEGMSVLQKIPLGEPPKMPAQIVDAHVCVK